MRHVPVPQSLPSQIGMSVEHVLPWYPVPEQSQLLSRVPSMVVATEHFPRKIKNWGKLFGEGGLLTITCLIQGTINGGGNRTFSW